MKKFLLSIIIFSCLSFRSFGHVDHYAKINYLEYELFRNNQSIGYHKYDFNREGDNLSILSEVNFKITKMGVDLYKYFAKSEENYERGILFCGTGAGMAIVANKVKGVRAVCINDPYTAERAIASNNAQIVTLGTLITGPEVAKKLVDIWLSNEFQGGGSAQKVDKINIARQNFYPKA